jgi:hypothetical protein
MGLGRSAGNDVSDTGRILLMESEMRTRSALVALVIFFSLLAWAQQSFPSTAGLATSPPAKGTAVDRTHAMLALPRSKVNPPKQNPSLPPASGTNTPQMLPVYPPGVPSR